MAEIRTRRLHVRKDKTNPRRLAYLALLLFARPRATAESVVGAVLIVLAVLLHGWAAGYLARAGYAERETALTVRGPYRYNRNPYYLAHLIMDLGFFMVAGWSFWYVLYLPIIFAVYRFWVRDEEAFLEREFGATYLQFKREVPRWRFRLRPAPGRGSDLSFRWATFRKNRELPRAASHLMLMTGFVAFAFFGNPFAALSVRARWTILVIVAVWLVLRDVRPLRVAGRSAGWAFAAIAIAVLAVVLLVRAPVWEPVAGAAAWGMIAAGLLLGGYASVTLYRELSSDPVRRSAWQATPVALWYVTGLALGLISCTLGGIWVAAMTAFAAWALDVAGVLPITPLPQGRFAALGLGILFACAGALALAIRLHTI